MCRIRLSIRAFKRLVCVGFGLGQLLCANASHAAECGDSSPDYTAQRSLVIGQEAKVSKVYVSGFKVREEGTDADGKQSVVLRLPDQGVTYVFAPDRKEAMLFPLPPPPGAATRQTRRTAETRPDGTVIRRFQLLSQGEWSDVSKTTCRRDGVMLEQVFTFIDRQGNMLAGSLTQSNIDVGPLPRSIFEVPRTVKIVDVRALPAQPPDRR